MAKTKNQIKRRRKSNALKLLSILVAFVIIAVTLCPLTVLAADKVDYSRKGSIYVDLKYKDKSIEDVELTIYKVADASKKNGDLTFRFTSEFKGFAKDTSTLSESDSPINLAKYIGINKIYGTPTRTDQNGHAEFTDLDLGLYLIVQTKKCEGYSTMTPFMVYMPFLAGDTYYYDVDATPKTDIEKVPEGVTSPNDFWFTDESGRPTYEDKGEDPTEDSTVESESSTTTTNMSSLNGNKKPGGSSTLIQTGQNKTLIPILAVAGAFVFILGLLVYKNEKK